MRTLSRRARAGALLAATLLPLSVLAQTEPRVSPDTPDTAPPPSAPDIQPGPAYDPSSNAPNFQPEAPPLPPPPPQDAPPPAPPETAAATPAPAPEPVSAPAPRFSFWRYSGRTGATQLDIGGSLGFNSPSGMYGGEIEWRMFPWVGVRASGGVGVWGTRVGPQLRVYPLGEVPISPFLEAGLSFNSGGQATVTVNDVRREAELLFSPSTTLAVGSRWAVGRLFFVSSRIGWSWNLRENNVRMLDGQPLDGLTDVAFSLLKHDGFVISGTVGMSLF